MMEFIISSIIAGFIVFIYVFFIYKINWIQDMTKINDKSTSLKLKYKMTRNLPLDEFPPVYPNGWFSLCESLELKKREIKHIAALGQNFAVFRTESGKARVVDAYCPHLGANMAEGGAVVGEELECHFHCWRFCGETGKCTDIPYSKNVPDSIKTKAWECVEVNGQIFIWYHAESVSPYWHPHQIENLANGKWVYQGRNEFLVNCHIQDIPENGSDWAHLPAIHVGSMIPFGIFGKIMRHKWDNISWTPKSTFFDEDSPDAEQDETTNEKHMAVIRLNHSLVLLKKFSILNLQAKAIQTGPGYTEIFLTTSLGPICVIETITPLQPLLQKVTHSIYTSKYIAPYARIILIGESIMFYRDVEVWNHKKFIANPILVSEDRNIKRFRRWFKQFYSKNSPTYESCRNTIEW